MSDLKCPKCGGTDFVSEIDLGVTISSEKNTGQLKFNMVKKIICADIGCRHILEGGVLRDGLVSKTKALLDQLKSQPVFVK